jgi:hypothetical protein
MAYGIAINTIFGFKEVTNQKIPKYTDEVLIDNSAASSGSFTAPGGVTSSNGFAFTTNASVIVSMSGSTVSWAYGSGLYNPSLPDWTIVIVKIT